MSEKKSLSLMDLDVGLGDLVKPITTLIEKISDATGAVFDLATITTRAKLEGKAQITTAKSEVAADLIKAESRIQISELESRALQRLVKEEANHQSNMESIVSKSLPQLEETADASQIDNDWIINFFDKCRIVSDDQMQVLWSKVLSGEANAPGSYSKRTVNFLNDLDKRDAEIFTKLCQFCWNIDNEDQPIVFSPEHEIYRDNGISFDTLVHLESIGLVSWNMTTGNLKAGLPRSLTVSYYDQILKLGFRNETDNILAIGEAQLTKIGQELAPICGSNPIDGFFDYVKQMWAQHSPEDITEQGDTADTEDHKESES